MIINDADLITSNLITYEVSLMELQYFLRKDIYIYKYRASVRDMVSEVTGNKVTFTGRYADNSTR